MNDLIEGQDLDQATVHELFVGYIVKSLVEANLVPGGPTLDLLKRSADSIPAASTFFGPPDQRAMR